MTVSIMYSAGEGFEESAKQLLGAIQGTFPDMPITCESADETGKI